MFDYPCQHSWSLQHNLRYWSEVLATREPICPACSTRPWPGGFSVESILAIDPERLSVARVGLALELHRPIETAGFIRTQVMCDRLFGVRPRENEYSAYSKCREPVSRPVWIK